MKNSYNVENAKLGKIRDETVLPLADLFPKKNRFQINLTVTRNDKMGYYLKWHPRVTWVHKTSASSNPESVS